MSRPAAAFRSAKPSVRSTRPRTMRTPRKPSSAKRAYVRAVRRDLRDASNWPGPIPSGCSCANSTPEDCAPKRWASYVLEARALLQEADRRGHGDDGEQDRAGRQEPDSQQHGRLAAAAPAEREHGEQTTSAHSEVEPGGAREREHDADRQNRQENELRRQPPAQESRARRFLRAGSARPGRGTARRRSGP